MYKLVQKEIFEQRLEGREPFIGLFLIFSSKNKSIIKQEVSIFFFNLLCSQWLVLIRSLKIFAE